MLLGLSYRDTARAVKVHQAPFGVILMLLTNILRDWQATGQAPPAKLPALHRPLPWSHATHDSFPHWKTPCWMPSRGTAVRGRHSPVAPVGGGDAAISHQASATQISSRVTDGTPNGQVAGRSKLVPFRGYRLQVLVLRWRSCCNGRRPPGVRVQGCRPGGQPNRYRGRFKAVV